MLDEGFMPLRVLIVEDNLDWEEVWKLVLHVFAEESEIFWATSVVEAKQLLSEKASNGFRFDIVICDIFLSGSLTGFDFFEYVDDQYKDSFIFVSSVKPNKVRASVNAVGHDVRVLQKPFRMKDAITELRAIQRKSSFRPEQLIQSRASFGPNLGGGHERQEP